MKHRLSARRSYWCGLLLNASGGAQATNRVNAVASFSILGDMVKQVGGDRVDVITLVGPDGDAHVYEPTPADAKNLASAQILFTSARSPWREILAALMEALQGLTADRIPDLPTAFSGTAGALTGPSWQRYSQRC